MARAMGVVLVTGLLAVVPGGVNAANPESPMHAATPIPEKLPNFTLRDRDGKATSIAVWRGKSLVLNFWATWCAPCRREIPLLKSLYGEWHSRRVEVIGVAVDDRAKVAVLADAMRIPYPLLIGEDEALDVAAQFGLEAPVFPFTVFTDCCGEVVTLYLGELHKAQAELILSVVADLNAGRIELAQARRTIARSVRGSTPKRSG